MIQFLIPRPSLPRLFSFGGVVQRKADEVLIFTVFPSEFAAEGLFFFFSQKRWDLLEGQLFLTVIKFSNDKIGFTATYFTSDEFMIAFCTVYSNWFPSFHLDYLLFFSALQRLWIFFPSFISYTLITGHWTSRLGGRLTIFHMISRRRIFWCCQLKCQLHYSLIRQLGTGFLIIARFREFTKSNSGISYTHSPSCVNLCRIKIKLELVLLTGYETDLYKSNKKKSSRCHDFIFSHFLKQLLLLFCALCELAFLRLPLLDSHLALFCTFISLHTVRRTGSLKNRRESRFPSSRRGSRCVVFENWETDAVICVPWFIFLSKLSVSLRFWILNLTMMVCLSRKCRKGWSLTQVYEIRILWVTDTEPVLPPLPISHFHVYFGTK